MKRALITQRNHVQVEACTCIALLTTTTMRGTETPSLQMSSPVRLYQYRTVYTTQNPPPCSLPKEKRLKLLQGQRRNSARMVGVGPTLLPSSRTRTLLFLRGHRTLHSGMAILYAIGWEAALYISCAGLNGLRLFSIF